MNLTMLIAGQLTLDIFWTIGITKLLHSHDELALHRNGDDGEQKQRHHRHGNVCACKDGHAVGPDIATMRRKTLDSPGRTQRHQKEQQDNQVGEVYLQRHVVHHCGIDVHKEHDCIEKNEAQYEV